MALLLGGLLLLVLAGDNAIGLPLRQRLLENAGRGIDRVAQIALLLGALGLLIAGYGLVEYQQIWLPPAWTHLYVLPVMFISCLFVGATFVASNLRRVTQHPFMWAVIFWSAAHLLVRGDLSSMVLFGGLGCVALLHIGTAQRASFTMPAVPWLNESMTVSTAGVIFIVTFFLHAELFGVSPSMMNRSFF